jgi:hypothetical protein
MMSSPKAAPDALQRRSVLIDVSVRVPTGDCQSVGRSGVRLPRLFWLDAFDHQRKAAEIVEQS